MWCLPLPRFTFKARPAGVSLYKVDEELEANMTLVPYRIVRKLKLFSALTLALASQREDDVVRIAADCDELSVG